MSDEILVFHVVLFNIFVGCNTLPATERVRSTFSSDIAYNQRKKKTHNENAYDPQKNPSTFVLTTEVNCVQTIRNLLL